MKSAIAFFIALMAVPNAASTQVAVWTPSVVVRAGFGDGEQDFGYPNLGRQSEEALLVVSCFYVSPDRILVFDWIRKEIKAYSIKGEYLKTLGTSRKDDELNRPLLVADILASADDIYLLVDHAGGPTGQEWSRFEVYVMDFRTGDIKDKVSVDIPDLGFFDSIRKDRSRVRIEGTVSLVKTVNGVGVYDEDKGETYRVIGNGAALSKAEQGVGERGWGYGTTRVRQKNREGEIELIVDGGHSAVTLPHRGGLAAVSEDSNYFVISQYNEARPVSEMYETILDMSGTVVARASQITYESGGSFEPGAALKEFELTTESGRPALYTVRTRASGVEIVRWGDSKE